MEIVFVTSALHGGGAERVIVSLANYFSGQGDTVTVLMTAGSEVAYEVAPEVRVCSIGRASRGNVWIQIQRLMHMRRFFKTHRDSKIIAFSTTINLYTILASLGLGNDVIVSERNDPARCRYKLFRNLVYRFGKRFVFQTEEARMCFPPHIRNKGVVIPNPLREGLPDVWSGEREWKIAVVGRLEPQKNHALLIRAFAGFVKKFPEYELCIFGKGGLEQELKHMAKDLGIGGKVSFPGFRKNVLEIIRSYRMFVLSSDYEGIPNSLMEAMALGIPCIATDCPIGGPGLCIKDGENGILIPVGAYRELQTAMEKIAGTESLAKELGKNAEEIRKRFSVEEVGRAWYACLGR